MKTINIKGKEYVEVNERLKYFRENYPKHSLVSEVVEKTESTTLILATIKDDNDRPIATGIAEEVKGSTFINKTSYVENCETSAWGRALANFGIGLDTSVASANEVENAIANQNTKPNPAKKETPSDADLLMRIAGHHQKGKSLEEIYNNMINTYPELKGSMRLTKIKKDYDEKINSNKPSRKTKK